VAFPEKAEAKAPAAQSLPCGTRAVGALPAGAGLASRWRRRVGLDAVAASQRCRS